MMRRWGETSREAGGAVYQLREWTMFKHKRLMEVGDRIEENQRDAGLMSISTKCVGFEISVTGIWMVRQDRLEI